MANAIAETLARTNGAELARAVALRSFYLMMAASPAAANSPGSWAVWENLRRRAPSNQRSHLASSPDAPWWVRREVR